MTLNHRKLWTIALAVGVTELSLLLGLIAALSVAQGGLDVTIGPHRDARVRSIAVPVAGVRREELRDSYGAARSGGRKHRGMDIFAPEGTPALAAQDAIVVERRNNALGGISLYLRDLDGVTIYYYAHLRGYRAGLKEGHLVRRGDAVGYVGRTGNVTGRAHLHFAVYTVSDPNRWWEGRDINPWTLLKPGLADH